MTELRKPTLAFCCPNYGPLDAIIYKNHLAVIANASRTFDVKFVGVTDKMYLHSACSELVRQSLMAGVDYIFWTENDMCLEFDCITRLYNNKKDICSGLYFLRGAAFMPCLFMYGDKADSKYMMFPVSMFQENAMIKVDCPGMGCVLYHTDVFRKLEEPFFDLSDGANGRLSYGQDTYFYRNVKDKGIEVWVDTSVLCEQLGDKTITSIADYKAKLMSKTKMDGFINLKKGE